MSESEVDQGTYWSCNEKLPERSGTYQILNNSGCNGGRGEMEFIKGRGWQVPEMIRSFYIVLGWYESE